MLNQILFQVLQFGVLYLAFALTIAITMYVAKWTRPKSRSKARRAADARLRKQYVQYIEARAVWGVK